MWLKPTTRIPILLRKKRNEIKVDGNVAIVRIDSKFGDVSFEDMFALVKDGKVWKIVSKVYNVK